MSQSDNLQRSYDNYKRMESQKAVQTPGVKGSQDKGESSHYPSYRRTTETERAYYDSLRITGNRPTQLSSGSTPFIQQQISNQESPFFTILGGFQEKTGIQSKNKTSFSHRQKE
ncbi:hypothetical protein O181_023432 [Austropuccinia psidii MF-1]|uniref:Uncharacterized protein n=1 Tax=Austropuccinia psidii MF-1 TaxID=1389203 RepID=A0A9Q3GY12_9BASI|nr:hypothetical protein [Austropuccinia psidii MF-1]